MSERSDWDDRDENTYDLSLPFIVCTSNGGPYEDVTFVAGFQMGRLDALLQKRNILAATFLIYRSLIKQADLITMKHRYIPEILNHDDDWIHLGVTRIEDEFIS